MNKIFFTLSLLLTICIVRAQSKAEKLDSIFTLLNQSDRFNGSILIAEKGIPIFEKSYGFSNVEQQELLTNNSIYKLNSVSKQFTAMGIIILKNKGKLRLTDELSQYIPELKFYKNVTIQNLLTHTHGIPDYDSIFEENWNKNKIADNKDIIKLYKKYKPTKRFNPGEKFFYGGIGFELLAVIIERVSHKSYDNFLTENIFYPLKMESTFDYHRFKHITIKKNIAIGYIYSDSLKERERPEILSNHGEVTWSNGIYGSGNIHTTTSDLLKWDKALYDTNFISKQDLDLIYGFTKLNDGNSINYGFGWWITEKEGIGKVVYHAGNSNGFETHFERHLDSDKTIIILQNFDATTPAIEAIDAILYNQPLHFVASRKEIQLSENELKKFEGNYAINENVIFNIFLNDFVLYAQLSGQSAIELIAETQNKFFVKKVDVQFEFIRNENEKIIKMNIFQNGNKMEAMKK
ncbi:MAG: serine hydrolase [Flavobacteriaceae bacterium]|nr:serine hydrolase [Flavobacteriaceae bacterium]|tara:strand:+ start:408 stop:1796 length:1389 start_codon:yes stop_codon:yes gene_type:complete